MPTTIAIDFDNPMGLFFPGQTITGHVKITCDKLKACNGVDVTLRGFGRVHWRERRTNHHHNRHDHHHHHHHHHHNTEWIIYTSAEEYYNSSQRVFHGGAGRELAVGTHVFPFSFMLPHAIPSSFESNIGQVRHYCEARMAVPYGFDKTCLRLYSINTLLDLNSDANARVPIECNKHKNFGCFCCKSGPLSLVLRIPRSGYVPGERIMINAECSNKSTTQINCTKAIIDQVITYYAGGHQKLEYRRVADLIGSGIDPGDDAIWSGKELVVPAVPPSGLPFCNIIDISYILKFVVSPEGMHFNLEHSAPITIGSIPLQEHFSTFMPSPGFQGPSVQAPATAPPIVPSTAPPTLPPPYTPGPSNLVNPAPPSSYLPSAPPSFPGLTQYPNMPPPSYDESVFGASTMEDQEGGTGTCETSSTFAPSYLSYKLAGHGGY